MTGHLPAQSGSLHPICSPWWADNVPESENDHTCTRCGRAVHVEHGVEWLGPDDNYHWNLCNSCAHELLVEMWQKLQAAGLDTLRLDQPASPAANSNEATEP